MFITGRRQENLDDAVNAIGHDVTGVRADSANLADLDRLYEIVRKEKGHIDVVFASAGLFLADEVLVNVSPQVDASVPKSG